MKTYMKTFFKKPLGMFSVVAAVAILGVGIWFMVRPNSKPVILVEAKLASIAETVSVTGRVKPVSAVDLAFKQSGKISKILVAEGDWVYVGEVLAELDASQAEGAVRDAEVNLENAKLTLEKINLQHAQQLRGDILNKNYEAGLGTLADLYGGFAVTLNALNNIFFNTDLSGQSQQNNIEFYASYKSDFASVPFDIKKLYLDTEDLYRQGLASYQATQRGGNGETRDQAIQEGYELTVKTAQMIKIGRNVIRSLTDTIIQDNLVHTKKTIIDSHSTDLANYAVAIDGYLQDLLTDINAINSERDTLETYPLDSKSQELTIKQRKNALRDATDRLNDYFIRSPIAGVVTKQDGRTGEIIAGNVKIISLISDTTLEIEANIPEADIAKIKLGNYAKVTLDAYNSNFMDVAFTATVTAIDPAEIIIDGVPTYKITLQFEKLTEGIKPGMTANLDITTASHNNVITIPQRAVVRQGNRQFVQMSANNQSKTIKEQDVTTGLRSSDGTIEILSGLNVGDKIIGNPVTTP